MSDAQSVDELLKELEQLKTPEEKEAHLQKHLSKSKDTTPQVIGLSEHGAIEGAEPCL